MHNIVIQYNGTSFGFEMRKCVFKVSIPLNESADQLEWEKIEAARSEISDESQSAGSPDMYRIFIVATQDINKPYYDIYSRVDFSRKSFLKTWVKPFIVVFLIYNIRTIIFIGFKLRAVAKILSGKEFRLLYRWKYKGKMYYNFFPRFQASRP